MGTTLIAIRYEDGVIVAADSQTSSGSYISNRASNKISTISDYIICLRSGSSADTQNMVDLVKNVVLKEQNFRLIKTCSQFEFCFHEIIF